jgi:ACS family tartrate transporter-like MFS transporter
MISWGLVSIGMILVSGTASFVVLRFLLGMAEAGFVPACIFYLAQWLPERQRCSALSVVSLAIPVSVIVGGPLSASILALDGYLGLSGWQWIFLIQGLPSITLGLVGFWVLTDSPLSASWLSTEQQMWLSSRLDEEAKEISTSGQRDFWAAARDSRTWASALAFFCVTGSTYGIVYWLPQVLHQFPSLDLRTVGWLSALPFGLFAVGMLANARHSDSRHERTWHFAAPCIFAAVCFLLCARSAHPWTSMFFLLAASAGLGAASGIFWTIPMSFLTGSAGVVGFAVINMVSSLAGFFTPLAIGLLRQQTGAFTPGLYVLTGLMVLGAAAGTLTGANRFRAQYNDAGQRRARF